MTVLSVKFICEIILKIEKEKVKYYGLGLKHIK